MNKIEVEKSVEKGHTFLRQSYSQTVAWKAGELTFNRKKDAIAFANWVNDLGGDGSECGFIKWLTENNTALSKSYKGAW
jgi:hypothetical protein